MAENSDIKKMVASLSNQDIAALINYMSKKSVTKTKTTEHWTEKNICALNSEGLALLKELETQLKDYGSMSHVDKKQLRYLRKLKKMKLEVPSFFRGSVEPKHLYRQLRTFCQNNAVPDEIVSRVVPAIVTYIETGHMRPIIFVGEKGCGKTTAARMLVEEALHIPSEIIKVPQTDGGHGMTGDCGSYQSADVGSIAKARLSANSIVVAYIFDEIDKVTHDRNRAGVDDELLSITDESNSDVFDNYLGTTLVGLEHCPMFFTANDLNKINPILADRCTVIHFPAADADRIKLIAKKYADSKLSSSLYSMIEFNYDLMFKYIDRLVEHSVTSLRKHQQMIEAVLESALDMAFLREDDETVSVTEDMFTKAEKDILGTVSRKLGFLS